MGVLTIKTKLSESGELPEEVRAHLRAHAGQEISITFSGHNPFDAFIGIIPSSPDGRVPLLQELRGAADND